MQAWTGDPERDAVGNRCKRLYCDIPVMAHAARVALGPGAGRLQPRTTLAALRQAGCELRETPEGRESFLVQTYARDTGTASICMSVPVFVKGQRFGAVIMGWEEANG